MARGHRYHQQFRADLGARVHWLRLHRPPEQRANLAAALAAFIRRVTEYPGIGVEVERVGTVSYRVRPIADPLPYIVWYAYDTAADDGVVSLLMLLHDAQDRERFDPSRFDGD